jgi:hypothetical protein
MPLRGVLEEEQVVGVEAGPQELASQAAGA